MTFLLMIMNDTLEQEWGGCGLLSSAVAQPVKMPVRVKSS